MKPDIVSVDLSSQILAKIEIHKKVKVNVAFIKGDGRNCLEEKDLVAENGRKTHIFYVHVLFSFFFWIQLNEKWPGLVLCLHLFYTYIKYQILNIIFLIKKGKEGEREKVGEKERERGIDQLLLGIKLTITIRACVLTGELNPPPSWCKRQGSNQLSDTSQIKKYSYLSQ